MRANPEIVQFGSGSVITTIDGTVTSTVTKTGEQAGVYAYFRNYTNFNTPDYWTKKRLKRPLPFNIHSVQLFRDSGTSFLNHVWTDNPDSLVNGLPDPIYEATVKASNACFYEPSISNVDLFSHISGARAIAENRLRKKVNGMTVNLAQAFGERKQTASLIANSVERVLKVSRAVKRGDFTGAARFLGVKDFRVTKTNLAERDYSVHRQPKG
jgi:hypothetical protein